MAIPFQPEHDTKTRLGFIPSQIESFLLDPDSIWGSFKLWSQGGAGNKRNKCSKLRSAAISFLSLARRTQASPPPRFREEDEQKSVAGIKISQDEAERRRASEKRFQCD